MMLAVILDGDHEIRPLPGSEWWAVVDPLSPTRVAATSPSATANQRPHTPAPLPVALVLARRDAWRISRGPRDLEAGGRIRASRCAMARPIGLRHPMSNAVRRGDVTGRPATTWSSS